MEVRDFLVINRSTVVEEAVISLDVMLTSTLRQFTRSHCKCQCNLLTNSKGKKRSQDSCTSCRLQACNIKLSGIYRGPGEIPFFPQPNLEIICIIHVVHHDTHTMHYGNVGVKGVHASRMSAVRTEKTRSDECETSVHWPPVFIPPLACFSRYLLLLLALPTPCCPTSSSASWPLRYHCRMLYPIISPPGYRCWFLAHFLLLHLNRLVKQFEDVCVLYLRLPTLSTICRTDETLVE